MNNTTVYVGMDVHKESFTLITKILMGTLGCVPAYDRYFIAGIKNQKVTTGNYNIRSIMQLVNFYEKNADRLEPIREKMEVEGMPYPQMKKVIQVLNFMKQMVLKQMSH